MKNVFAQLGEGLPAHCNKKVGMQKLEILNLSSEGCQLPANLGLLK